MWRTLCKISTFNYEFPNERPQKHPTNIPQGVGADLSRPYPYITKYAFSHYQIHIFVSSQTDVHILKYVYSNHRTHISVRHFVGVYIYVGTINRPLRLLVGCEQGNEHSVENLCSLTKWVANILLYRLFSIVILFVRC